MNHLDMIAALHLQYPQSLPWVILLTAVFAFAVVLAYARQTRQLLPVWRWLLPLFRLLAVAVISLSILRPVVTRPRTATERAPVVVLMDDSHSMSVVDTIRPSAEVVGIADELGQLPADARDNQTRALQADCDQLSTLADDVARCEAEVEYARLSGRGQDVAGQRLDQAVGELESTARNASVKAVDLKSTELEKALAYLLRTPVGINRQFWLEHLRPHARAAADEAEQARFARDAELYRTDPQVRDACRPLKDLSRLQLSEHVLLEAKSGLIACLGTDTPVVGFAVSDAVTPIPIGGSVEPTLSADGTSSNLTGGVRTVLESMGTMPPRAVVLISDGRLSGADGLPAVAQGVPIFTVAAATRSGIQDLTILNATVPSSAVAGETIVVKAVVRAAGFTGSSSELKITGGGADETRSLLFTNDRPVNLQFNRTFSEPGMQRIMMSLAPAAGEISYENNQIERWLTVQPAPVGRLPATRPGEPARPSAPATRPAVEVEMADLTGDEDSLRRLAESTGGQFFRLDQIHLLAKRLLEIHDDVNQTVDVPLWDGPYLICVVLGCLAAEWGLRKRVGLV